MRLPAHRYVTPLKLNTFLRSIETRERQKDGKMVVTHVVVCELIAAVPSRNRYLDFFILEIVHPEGMIQPYMIVRRELGKEHITRYYKTVPECEVHLIKILSRLGGKPDAKN